MPFPKSHCSGVHAVLRNGENVVRLVSSDVKQTQNIDYGKDNKYTLKPVVVEGTINFPLVTAAESILREMYENVEYNKKISDWSMSYLGYMFNSTHDISYTLKHVDSVTFSVEQSSALC